MPIMAVAVPAESRRRLETFKSYSGMFSPLGYMGTRGSRDASAATIRKRRASSCAQFACDGESFSCMPTRALNNLASGTSTHCRIRQECRGAKDGSANTEGALIPARIVEEPSNGGAQSDRQLDDC